MIIVETWIKESSKEERQSHLDLTEPCIERGGCSTNHKGVLAQYLNTTIPHGREHKIHLCHACHNGECSNPKHLYWGTPSENELDSISNGKQSWSKGKKIGPQSAETCLKKSMALKGRPSNRNKIVWDDVWLIEQKINKVTNCSLAKILGVSEGAIRKRLKKLEFF